VFVLENYRKLSVYGAKAGGLETSSVEKGHREELVAFALAVRNGGEWPVPLWQQVQATEIALLVEDRLSGAP